MTCGTAVRQCCKPAELAGTRIPGLTNAPSSPPRTAPLDVIRTLPVTSIAAGVDLKVVSQTMGHATSAFTADVYVMCLKRWARLRLRGSLPSFLARPGGRPRDDRLCHQCAILGLFDHGNGVRGDCARQPGSGVSTGGGGGRESNPPTALSVVHQF